MNFIWSDFNVNSANSQKGIMAKRINGPDYWSIMREVFDYDCKHLPLSRFRLWASVHNVPLVTQQKTSRFIGESFYAAAHDVKIADALQENWIGIPVVMSEQLRIADTDTSMQRIQDLAHLLITDFTNFTDINSIVEIGAGYGDMCSVIYSLGFKGKYTIVDIPELKPIQEYYLNKQNIYPTFSFEDELVTHSDLVIATWSLSETDLEYRNRLMPKIRDSKQWMILSQSKIFGNSYNEEYFEDFFKDKSMKKIPLINSVLNTWDKGNTYYVVKN